MDPSADEDAPGSGDSISAALGAEWWGVVKSLVAVAPMSPRFEGRSRTLSVWGSESDLSPPREPSLSSRSDPDPNVQQSNRERKLLPFDGFLDRVLDLVDMADDDFLDGAVADNAIEVWLFQEAWGSTRDSCKA